MPSLKELQDGTRNVYGHMDARCWTVDARAWEREEVLAFIREQATKGTADYEHKLMKLADAIERGEHEQP